MRTLLALWDELRQKRGPYHFALRGVSMWPAAPSGSILAIEPCRAEELSPGDLVTFRRRGQIVTHRVLTVLPDKRVVAWGDSVLHADAPIDPSDVFGRATILRRGVLVTDWRTGWIAIRRLFAGLARLASRRSTSA